MLKLRGAGVWSIHVCALEEGQFVRDSRVNVLFCSKCCFANTCAGDGQWQTSGDVLKRCNVPSWEGSRGRGGGLCAGNNTIVFNGDSVPAVLDQVIEMEVASNLAGWEVFLP